MGKGVKKTAVLAKLQKKTAWLLFFYTVPSKPVNNRIKLWRRISRAGAVQLKGAVYVLPHNEEHYEFCQWLMEEVSALSGEGDFVIADNFEMLSNSEIITLFKRQRESDYIALEKKLNDLEVKLNSMEKGSRVKNADRFKAEFDKLLKEYNEITAIDFFPARKSSESGKKISSLQKKLAHIIKPSDAKEAARKKTAIPRRNSEDYKRRIWITRHNPFVDRIASAWLIKKYIDKDAVFRFIDEQERENADKNAVIYDMKDGEITHTGDHCTFEVLVKSFAIRDKAVRKIAELVHELDIKDGKFSCPEAKGIGEILQGIRKTGRDDKDILEKGMDVFEMLYASHR